MLADQVRKALIILAVCLTVVGCNKERREECVITRSSPSSFTYQSKGVAGQIQLVAVDSIWEVQHLIHDLLTDVWTLKDAVYQFDCGDLTGDGIPEILVGVIKATRYRHEQDKRLFIFHLYKGRKIRPLWLGSRLGLPLKDFKVERDSVPAMIHTWERDTDGTTVERVYRQQGFGLKYVSEFHNRK
ncbi:MAG: nuclear receptor-binding factor 2 [Bacteroidaceae bacterium]|nr:nuclear receptor-binding factor 2 [Bacteroidaceae bacterium]